MGRLKIHNTTTSMLVDSGAQSTVLGKKQFDNLVRDALKQNCNHKKEICESMGMATYRLWVSSRQVSSVTEGKLSF